MALKLLLLLAAASTATATSLHGGPQPLRRRTNQPKDQSSLAVKAIHRVRGGSTGGLDYRFFVAGSISAALSHGYTTPIDVIKTRMQTNPELYNGSAILALRMIVESDGAHTATLTRMRMRTRTHTRTCTLTRTCTRTRTLLVLGRRALPAAGPRAHAHRLRHRRRAQVPTLTLTLTPTLTLTLTLTLTPT